MYGSTIEALKNLYPGLAIGGYLVVDDYGAIANARQAVDDFRAENGIRERIQRIDTTGIYWRRASA